MKDNKKNSSSNLITEQIKNVNELVTSFFDVAIECHIEEVLRYDPLTCFHYSGLIDYFRFNDLVIQLLDRSPQLAKTELYNQINGFMKQLASYFNLFSKWSESKGDYLYVSNKYNMKKERRGLQKIEEKRLAAIDAYTQLKMYSKSESNEDSITEKIIQALSQIQNNSRLWGATENDINKEFRDRLEMVFECHDNTRQGISENEVDSGEVDLLIKKRGIPFAIIESIRLKSLVRDYVKRHINKVLKNYDANGCKTVCLVVYGLMVDFGSFWTKIHDYLLEFDYPYEIVSQIMDVDTGLAELKHAKILMKRQGTTIAFHVFAIHMREKSNDKI